MLSHPRERGKTSRPTCSVPVAFGHMFEVRLIRLRPLGTAADANRGMRSAPGPCGSDPGALLRVRTPRSAYPGTPRATLPFGAIHIRQTYELPPAALTGVRLVVGQVVVRVSELVGELGELGELVVVGQLVVGLLPRVLPIGVQVSGAAHGVSSRWCRVRQRWCGWLPGWRRRRGGSRRGRGYRRGRRRRRCGRGRSPRRLRRRRCTCRAGRWEGWRLR